MLYWEYNDGTFGAIPLVTSRRSADATLDNREDQGEGGGKQAEREDSTSTSSAGTSASERPTHNDRWRTKGHSQR